MIGAEKFNAADCFYECFHLSTWNTEFAVFVDGFARKGAALVEKSGGE